MMRSAINGAILTVTGLLIAVLLAPAPAAAHSSGVYFGNRWAQGVNVKYGYETGYTRRAGSARGWLTETTSGANEGVPQASLISSPHFRTVAMVGPVHHAVGIYARALSRYLHEGP